jgi:hypothetical protein
MKYRVGFVSNSSSSSFVVYGVCADSFDEDNFSKEIWDEIKETDDDASVDIQKIIKRADKLKLNFEYTDYLEGVGIPYCNMKQEETRREFEARAKEKVDEFFGKSTECEYVDKVIED